MSDAISPTDSSVQVREPSRSSDQGRWTALDRNPRSCDGCQARKVRCRRDSELVIKDDLASSPCIVSAVSGGGDATKRDSLCRTVQNGASRVPSCASANVVELREPNCTISSRSNAMQLHVIRHRIHDRGCPLLLVKTRLSMSPMQRDRTIAPARERSWHRRRTTQNRHRKP